MAESSSSTYGQGGEGGDGMDEWTREVTTDGTNTTPLSIEEIYMMAASIGKEFERIIDRRGPDAVCGLMSKVIHVLEELEEQTQKRESQQEELAALQAAVERLQANKVARAEAKRKVEQVSTAPHCIDVNALFCYPFSQISSKTVLWSGIA